MVEGGALLAAGGAAPVARGGIGGAMVGAMSVMRGLKKNGEFEEFRVEELRKGIGRGKGEIDCATPIFPPGPPFGRSWRGGPAGTLLAPVFPSTSAKDVEATRARKSLWRRSRQIALFINVFRA
jgi:hypothetical protein